MSDLTKCAACRTERQVSEMQICMHAQMHYYVCDGKCMHAFYNPPKKPSYSELAVAHDALRAENERLSGLLRDTASVAITMLYDSHKADVLAEFKASELEAVVDASKHLQSHRVEHVYRRAWDAALSAPAAGQDVSALVVLPGPIEGNEFGEYGQAMRRGYEAFRRELLRLNPRLAANKAGGEV